MATREMEAGSVGGGSAESEIARITKTAANSSSCGEREGTTDVCDGGGGDGDPAADVSQGCDQASPPEMDPANGARKPEKLALHADAAVAPVASTSFKRSGGTGSGSTSSRRTVQKRVVTVPIADIGEGSRARTGGASAGGVGDGAPPPSDSWTWRKYGQKPIKGSPYPRGYYRCSSSKGCPARKQVERSRADPTLLIVTYTSEHNHPWPMPRNGSHHGSRQSAAAQAALGGGGGAGPPPPALPAGKPPPPPSSSSTDEEDMEVEYENAVAQEVAVVGEVDVKIPVEPEFTAGFTASTTPTATTTTTTTTTGAPGTTSSPSEETETVSADHSISSAASDVDSATLMPPLAAEGGVDDLCSAWFPSETEISLCSTADTATTMLPFSYDELLADLGGRSGGYGVDEDEDSLFAGLGELPEFSLVFRRGMQHAADFSR